MQSIIGLVRAAVTGVGFAVSQNDRASRSSVVLAPDRKALLMKSTVVLVHGAFAESASWDGVVAALLDADLPVIAAANPLRGLAADAESVSDVVRSIDGPIVLVAHSYGGAVISNVDADAGEIVGLVYVNGFAPECGENCFGLAACFPAACSARRRCGRCREATGRPISTSIRTASTTCSARRPRAAGRADGRDAAPRHPGGSRRAVGRPSAVEGRAVVVPTARLTASSRPPSSASRPSAPGAAHARARRRLTCRPRSQPGAVVELILEAARSQPATLHNQETRS